jgi:hypothetical protein
MKKLEFNFIHCTPSLPLAKRNLMERTYRANKLERRERFGTFVGSLLYGLGVLFQGAINSEI